VTALELATPHGSARAHLATVDRPVGALVLGHGAGGGVNAPDLQAVARAAVGVGWSVALVEQPYRVAGRRSPPPTRQLDAAWAAVVEQLTRGPLARLALVTGGRSAGGRVACRTAATLGAVGVLCLAFPLEPPARRGAQRTSRLAELEAVEVPTLVVQGDADPFGRPPEGPQRKVVIVRGTHSLARDLQSVAAAAAEWLERVRPGHARQAAR
jgi:predicted alpha/beta-hydrolase family hydrolase